MPEACPLLGENVEVDHEGFVWQTNIPDTCQNCLNGSFSSRAELVSDSYDIDPDELHDQNSSMLGGFYNYGIKVISASKRQAIEEIGDEGTDELDGAILEVNKWVFSCRKLR